MKSFIVGILLFLVPSLALAAPPAAKMPSGREHSPPVIMDEASVRLWLNTRGDDGYDFSSWVEMTGVTSKTDSARIEWKQNGKLLATGKCTMDLSGTYATSTCNYAGTPLKVKGDIEANLIYWDDQAEKDYLVRTFKLKVYSWKGQWPTWQIMPDDLLSAGWMYMGYANREDGTYRHLELWLWFSNGDYLSQSSLRCTVNGTKKLPDFAVDPQGGGGTGDVEADTQPINGERVTYRWQKMDLMFELLWGRRDTLKWDMPKTQPKDTILSDNPGKWDCNLRKDGKTIREILFNVDKDGMVLQDEIQTAKDAIPTVSNKVTLVDLRLTKDSQTFDKRINPAAMKKSMGYGLPWPTHPKVKIIQASYPPKSGQPDPK
jgi:hypothetical protein